MTATSRLDSVDALRGLTVAAMLLVNDAGDWSHVFAPLEHAAWHGCTPTDLVFPFFLVIVGVSITLALGPRIDAGADRAALRRGVLLRALRIVVLGLVLHAAAHWLMHTREFRPLGVLQRIGLCFGAAGLIAIETRPRMQWLIFAALLLGYWGLLVAGGPLDKQGNLAGRIDSALLGRFAYEFDAATGRAHEPEGLLSTLPAIATTLLGVRAGDWLRRRRSARLLATGVVAIVAGWLWSLVLPLNKQLWTSSYVLYSGGFALVALWAAHELVDRRGVPALGRSFGVNAIAAYAGAWLMVCVLVALHALEPLYRIGFGWIVPLAGPYVASLAYAVAFTMLWWLVMRGLDRRAIRIRI
jgi:predicted acyltransferase